MPTLPDVESREVLHLGLSEPERRGYIDVVAGADLGYLPAMSHHLLGYPYNLGDSTFIAGFMWTHGIPDPYEVTGWERVKDRIEAERREIQHKAEMKWRLLLQVYSNEEAEMDWSGGGVLHFCMPKDALSRRDFTRVWVNLQSL